MEEKEDKSLFCHPSSVLLTVTFFIIMMSFFSRKFNVVVKGPTFSLLFDIQSVQITNQLLYIEWLIPDIYCQYFYFVNSNFIMIRRLTNLLYKIVKLSKNNKLIYIFAIF